MQPARSHRSTTATRRRAALRRASLGSALALLLASAGRAAVITEWDVASATGQDVAVLTSAANTSASSIGSVGVAAWPFTTESGFSATSGWAAGLIRDPGRYYQFSVSADPGFAITFQTVSLALFRGIQSPDHGAQRWDLYASPDVFASELLLASFDISGSSADTQTQFLNTDISALGIRQGTITFRLFGYDYTSSADYSGLGNDSGWLISGTGSNVILNGTVDVVVPSPEPGTAAMALLGLFWLAVAGRSRRLPAVKLRLP